MWFTKNVKAVFTHIQKQYRGNSLVPPWFGIDLLSDSLHVKRVVNEYRDYLLNSDQH